jgi:hypothetical protein
MNISCDFCQSVQFVEMCAAAAATTTTTTTNSGRDMLFFKKILKTAY